MLTLSERQRRITSKHRSGAARQRWARERQCEAQRRQEAQGRAVFDEALRDGALILTRRNTRLEDRYYLECRRANRPCLIVHHGPKKTAMWVDYMSTRGEHVTDEGVAEFARYAEDTFTSPRFPNSAHELLRRLRKVRRGVECRCNPMFIRITAPTDYAPELLRRLLALPTCEYVQSTAPNA
jgi:hypothetical protein